MWTCPKCGREFKRTNQSHYCGASPETIEEYLDRLSDPAATHTRTVIQIIQEDFPQAVQKISWGMPYFVTPDRSISLAANKNALSLYVGEQVIEALAEKLKILKTKKSAIYFPYNQPVPEKLVREIVRKALEG